jgi:hypothetical protein
MTPERPSEKEFAPFYAGYVGLVPETDIIPVLRQQPAELDAFARVVPEDGESFRYGPEKWSIREVFGHMNDGERVFGYRLFCISRGEQASLPGFDEKTYVAAAGYDRRALKDLVQDFGRLRESNVALLENLDDAAWRRAGNANGSGVSVRALSYIMAGHVRHHLGVLESRYRT